MQTFPRILKINFRCKYIPFSSGADGLPLSRILCGKKLPMGIFLSGSGRYDALRNRLYPRNVGFNDE